MTEIAIAQCRNCGGEGWVCENHPDKPWDGLSSDASACGCGAGSPCGACNLEMASAGYVERERDRIIAWLKGLPANYSGWNDHDEHFDNGYNCAVAAIAEALVKRAPNSTAPDPSRGGRS